MKLTITIEEEKESDVRVERPGGAAVTSGEERPSEIAATSAGGPPEWLLAELEEGAQAQEGESGGALDAGPAPASTNGVSLMRV